MAIVSAQVQTHFAASFGQTFNAFLSAATFTSPSFYRLSVSQTLSKFIDKLSKNKVLVIISPSKNFSFLFQLPSPISSSPLRHHSRKREPCVFYARDGTTESPVSRHTAPSSEKEARKTFDFTRKFHNQNKTKIMILSHDRGDRLYLPNSRKKIINVTSVCGHRYTLCAPCKRNAHSYRGKTHIPFPRKSADRKKKTEIPVRALNRKPSSERDAAGKKKNPRKGDAFKPKTRNFDITPRLPDTERILNPSVEVRPKPIPNATFSSRKPYLISEGRFLVIGGRLGLHATLTGNTDRCFHSMLKYLTCYEPEVDDFIVSFSVNGDRYNIKVRGSGVVDIVPMFSDEVTTTSASRDYLTTYRMRSRGYIHDSILSRYHAPRGYCYLNHIFFLSLRAGCAFRPAKNYFKTLGRNPSATDLSARISAYFGFAAASYHIAGRYTGYNRFHCDNSSRRLYTLEYLREAAVGAEVEDEEVNTSLTDVGRVKALTQVHDSLRANRESLLVKSMEMDLVDFLNTTKNLQRGKEKLRVPFMLTEVQQSRLIQAYPHFHISFTSSSASDHPMAAASRLLENRTLVSFCSDHFIDVGGCPLHHYYFSKTKRVHVCRPVYDSKDAQRRVLRNTQLKSPLKAPLDEDGSSDAPFVPSIHTSCAKVIDECSYSADYMVMVQVYDIPLETLCASMSKRKVSVCYLTMITPGEILDRREAFHHGVLNCDITLDVGSDTITYKFGSSCYTHTLSTITQYMTTPVYSYENNLYSIEMTGERCGVNYYVITRSEVSPAIDCQKVIRYRRCCEGLVRVKLPKFCKKTRKCLPGVDYVFVDADFVERIHQYVIGNCSVVNSKTFEWTWNYVKSSKSRVVISGKMIQRDVSISLDQMEPMVVVMLAAGVRSRQASEYLAKNVALYTGGASILDVLLFSLKEKYRGLKQSFNDYLTTTLKGFFADVLLMEFLDLDDAFTYYDNFSEITVGIKQQGFGAIDDGEVQALINSRCSSDVMNSAIVSSLPPPKNKKSNTKASAEGPKDPHGRERGLYAAGRRNDVLTSVIDMFLACRDILGNAAADALSLLKGVFSRILKEFGSFGSKLRLLYDSTMSLAAVFSYPPKKTAELLLSAFSHFKLVGCSFANSYMRTVKEILNGISAKGDRILQILKSYISAISSAAHKSHSRIITEMKVALDALAEASYFDFHEELPFEVAVSVIQKFIFDIPSVLTGKISPMQCVLRCATNLVFELNLNLAIAKIIGPSDTLKKDMFNRTVSSLISSAFLDRFTFSPETFIRLSTVVPMVVRKLLVSFFSDDFSYYVGQVKYGVDDFSAFKYARRNASDAYHSILDSLCHSFESYLDRVIDKFVETVKSTLLETLPGKEMYSSLLSLKGGVHARYQSLKKRLTRARKTQTSSDDEDDFFSTSEDSELLNEKPGLFGNGPRIQGVISCGVGFVNDLLRSFRRLLSILFIRCSRHFVANFNLNLLSDYSRTIRLEYEDHYLKNTYYLHRLSEDIVQSFQLERSRSQLRVPREVLRTGVCSTVKWVVSDLMSFIRRRLTSKSFLYYDLPHVILAFYTLPQSPLFFSLQLGSYVCELLHSDDVKLFLKTTYTRVGSSDTTSVTLCPVSHVEPILEDSPLSETESDESETNDLFRQSTIAEIENFSDENTSAAPGLFGEGHRISLISFIIRQIGQFIKCALSKSSRSLTLIFLLGSVSNSLLFSKWSTTFSKFWGLFMVFLYPKSMIFPLVSETILRQKFFAPLRSILRKISALSSYLEKIFYTKRVAFSKIPDKRPAYLPVRAYKSGREELNGKSSGVASIVESLEKIAHIKQAVKTTMKSVEHLSEFSEGSETSSGYSSSSDEGAAVDQVTQTPPGAANSEKTQLLPIISEFAAPNREVKHSVSSRKEGLCKYLQSLNICSRPPVPYTQVAPLPNNYSRCTNAVREFYFLQEVSLFDLHYKFLRYWEQLKCMDFDRTRTECEMDEDLYVYTSSAMNFAPKKRSRVPLGLAHHEMMFTEHGMVLNDPKYRHNKLQHEQLAFVSANAFLRGCEYHSSVVFDNSSVCLMLYEAPPGGGKTTSLIDLYFSYTGDFKCLIVTANKNSQIDIKNKVNKRAEKGKAKSGEQTSKAKGSGKDVMTIDSYLMNYFSSRCDILFVDECFMVHAGQVLAIINASQCRRCILFGDSRQIHFIQRNETCSSFYGGLNSFIPPSARVYGEISYRCPWDVCQWLSKVYKNAIKSNNVESLGKSSVAIREIEGLDSVPILSGVKYVTFTQGEKSELERFLKPKLPKVEVNTVHEVQGETFSRVALVRTKYQEDTPFVSENHIIVALSRHVESLHYYVLSSRCFDDTSRAIKEMIEISEKYKTLPNYFSGSSIQMEVTGEPVDNSSCKALSAPLQSLNDFLEEIVPGSTSINFGDPSAEMSVSPFECAVDGVTIHAGDNGSRLHDHDPARV
uniref:ORF1 n=1 Tax=Carrot yellow leaf virus TaxID=656190 RepID=A0A0A0P704_9CLOS|nr:ORF1 [Carrot yellow leaf virus]